MKKILTIVICKKFEGEIDAPYDEIELLYTDGDYDSADIIKNAVKQANGKYITFSDGAVEIPNLGELDAALDKASCDILEIRGGLLFRTQLVRALSAKDICDRMSVEVKSALNAKNFVHSNLTFLTTQNDRFLYSESNAQLLIEVVDDFNKQKSKVSKETYAFARDLLCNYLYYFYADAMMKIRTKELESQTLAAFDDKLKENIVLYLALAQRFKGVNMQKLRERKFKIGAFDALALKKILK